MRLAYLADLGGIVFGGSAEHPTSWVHALPGGAYKHPVYGDLIFDDARIHRFAESVTKKYRKIDPDIDYDHKQDAAMGNKAAGWVQTAEVRPKGTTHADFGEGVDEGLTFGNDLWVLVEWTPAGAQAVKNKEYRYFSSELADEWTSEDGTTYKDVFFGGGVTNRPYMKELLPLNLSDLSLGDTTSFKTDPHGSNTDVPHPTNQGDQVDPKELRRKLRLAEDASDAEVDAKLVEINKLTEPPKPDDKGLSELMKLAEGNPIVAQFLEQQKQTTAALAEVQSQLRLSETTRKLAELTPADAKVGFNATTLNELTDVMMGAPTALADKVFKLFKSVADGTGITLLGEIGRAGSTDREGGGGGNKSIIEQFHELVKQFQDQQMEYADAVDAASRSNPKLYSEYRNASYIKARGE
jgi:hypothetical protein